MSLCQSYMIYCGFVYNNMSIVKNPKITETYIFHLRFTSRSFPLLAQGSSLGRRICAHVLLMPVFLLF